MSYDISYFCTHSLSSANLCIYLDVFTTLCKSMCVFLLTALVTVDMLVIYAPHLCLRVCAVHLLTCVASTCLGPALTAMQEIAALSGKLKDGVHHP